MPIFQQLLNELAKLPPDQQVGYINRFRTDQVKEIAALTGRGLLVYAADFKKSLPPQFGITNSITWEDKTCFADLVDGFDSKQVDVFIHSPGGSVEATESLVALLRDNFDEVRFFVPNMAIELRTSNGAPPPSPFPPPQGGGNRREGGGVLHCLREGQ